MNDREPRDNHEGPTSTGRGLPPLGRVGLPWEWWNRPFEPGTTLAWREQIQQRRAQLRALGKLKRNVDKRQQGERRSQMVHDWSLVAYDDPDAQLCFGDDWLRVLH